MKKIVSFIIIAFVSAFNLFGQNGSDRFDVGLGFAPFFLTSKDEALETPYKYDAYFEWRHDFGKRVDVGARIDYKGSPARCYNSETFTRFYGSQHAVAVQALADFNCLPGKSINPYIGIGLGPALIVHNWTSKETAIVSDTTKLGLEGPLGAFPSFTWWVVSPRAGVELFNHLRLSSSVDVSLSELLWAVCFNVGWTF